MPRIFISYRREDSITAAGRIYDNLANSYGTRSVFLDTEDIPPGVEWDTHLTQNITGSDVVLVIIGDKWLTVTDSEGNRRLDLADDFVRFEVEVALRQPGIKVIPVLLKNARMPSAEELPESLQELPRRNAIQVRDGADFHPDMERLSRAIHGKPQRNRFLYPALIGIGMILVLAILSLIFTLLNSNKPLPPIGNASIYSFHDTDMQSNETMKVEVQIIMAEIFVTPTPQGEAIPVTVNEGLELPQVDPLASDLQTPQPARRVDRLNRIPPYVIIELDCPGERFEGCDEKFIGIEINGINSIQWVINTPGQVSGEQDLTLRMYTADARGNRLSDAIVWNYTFTITVRDSNTTQQSDIAATATAQQSILDAAATVLAQQTIVAQSTMVAQAVTVDAGNLSDFDVQATRIAGENLFIQTQISASETAAVERATAFVETAIPATETENSQIQVAMATQNAGAATQVAVDATRTTESVVQQTADTSAMGTQTILTAQAVGLEDATQTAVAMEMTLNPVDTSPTPTSSGENVSQSSIQQTATALASFFNATPTQAELIPTSDSGQGGGFATAVPATVDPGQGVGGTLPDTLPDTGLFDNIAGIPLPLIIIIGIVLTALIVISRSLRARFINRND